MALIDRSRVMTDYLENLGRNDSYKAKYEALVKAVDDGPAIDAVPVVRCKDCVYYKPGKHFKDINFCQRLPYYAEKGGLNVSDEDFCSYGERRNADNSRDLSGYADKLREIKAEQAKKSAEKAKKSAEKAKKSMEKALEKVGLA